MVMTVLGFGSSKFKTFEVVDDPLFYNLLGIMLLGLHYFFSFQVADMATSTQMGINRFGDPMSWFFVIVRFSSLHGSIRNKHSMRWK